MLRFLLLRSLLVLLLLLLLVDWNSIVVWAAPTTTPTTPTKSSSSSSSSSGGGVIRRGNLDYLDPATVQYYSNFFQSTSSSSMSLEYDIVILFYAPWCKNCHALAPSWDQISKILNAGSISSNLIVGLFNCEADLTHATVCNTVGITHYPTILYFNMAPQQHDSTTTSSPSRTGSSGTTFVSSMVQNIGQFFFTNNHNNNNNNNNKVNPAQQSGSIPKHIVPFTGDWQYTGAILDWIRAMSFLSRYQRIGWSYKLRHLLLQRRPFQKSKSNVSSLDTKNNKLPSKNALPVGIPKTSPTTTTNQPTHSETSPWWNPTTSNQNNRNNPSSDELLTELSKKYKDAQSLVTRNAILLESLLYPVRLSFGNHSQPPNVSSSSTSSMERLWTRDAIQNPGESDSPFRKLYTDAFAYLYAMDAWNVSSSVGTDETTAEVNLVYTTCVSDLSLDYCGRLSTTFMYDWIDRNPTVTDITDDVFALYSAELNQYVVQREPYCAILDRCIANNFIDDDDDDNTVQPPSSTKSTKSPPTTKTNVTKPTVTTSNITSINHSNDHTQTPQQQLQQPGKLTCTPPVCPFRDDVACRYISACLTDDMLAYYDTALTNAKNMFQQQQQQQSPKPSSPTATPNEARKKQTSSSTKPEHNKQKQQTQPTKQYKSSSNQDARDNDDKLNTNDKSSSSSWGLKR